MTTSAATPSKYQISLLQHSLGINEGRRTPFRNHFVAGDGHHDIDHLRGLESMGLMTARDNGKPWGGLCFYVTDAGKDIAIAQLPPQRRKTRYEEFLDEDCGYSFGEYLCRRGAPKFESQINQLGKTEYRMVRIGYDGRILAGNWFALKKDAKASYKAALGKTLPDSRMSRRTEVYNCAGCGRFVGDAQRFSGNCAKCGADNRP